MAPRRFRTDWKVIARQKERENARLRAENEMLREHSKELAAKLLELTERMAARVG